MQTKSLIILCIYLPVLFSCKKDKTKRTSITGTVINITNNKPVEGLAVGLLSSQDTRGGLIPFGKTMWGDYKTLSMRATTDAEGRFIFENVEIHTHPEYRYQLFTVSSESLNNGRHDFGDASIDIDKGDLHKNYRLEVHPFMDKMWIQLNPSTPIVFPDSVNIVVRHQFSNQNGSMPLTYTVTSECLKTGYKCNAAHFDLMGRWYLDMFKYKKGISSTTRDSVMMNYGDSLTYMLNF
jgi:hypothetical protein